MALTKLQCDHAACPPCKVRLRLADEDGLYLEVTAAGSKYLAHEVPVRRQGDCLVGPNKPGKSTIVGELRILHEGLRRGKRLVIPSRRDHQTLTKRKGFGQLFNKLEGG